MALLRFTRKIGMSSKRIASNSEEMQIFVRTPANRTITLMLDRFDKIATIKAKIEDKSCYPCSRQCLIFSGKRLDDEETLATYHISKDSTLQLKLLSSATIYNIVVQILPSNRFISLRVAQGLKATIREVKDLIREEEGIDCEDLYLDDDIVGVGDNMTLEDCHIPEQTLVCVQSSTSSPPSSERHSSPQRSRATVAAAFEDACTLRRTVPGSGDIEQLEVQEVAEQKSYQAEVSDVHIAIASLLQSHGDCERKLSLMLDEKNKLQKDLMELQRKYPRLLSVVLDEKNKLQRDLWHLQSEFPRQLSLVVEEKNRLQRHLTELQLEFPRKISLVLDENNKLQRDSTKLQNELDSVKIELGQERERSLCTICFDRPRDTLVFSCLHLHFCARCLEKHQERSSTCPTCRGFIIGKLICNVSIS